MWKVLWDSDGDEDHAYCDTDFAVCKKTRRSTSGGVLVMGGFESLEFLIMFVGRVIK